MLEVVNDSVKGYKDIPISYNLIKGGQESKKLMIVFPGAGYTVQGPLLHYSTGVCLNNGFDVLEVAYQYTDKVYNAFSTEEFTMAIEYDVRTVINKVVNDSLYEKFVLIGKSLGTIAMSSELSRDLFSEARAIWLTPLLQRDDVFEAMVHRANKSLCFIGDDDPCYIADRFDQISNNRNMNAQLISGLNHALEYNDQPIKSIDVLKRVMIAIDEFVSEV